MEKEIPTWHPSTCSADNYPVMVIDGILTYSEKGGVTISHAYATDSYWGDESASRNGIESGQIPDGVGIKWYSYVENKFYSGFCDLPADTIETLFSKGFVQADTKIPGNYTAIVVGMAPHGVVSVWLFGDGTVTEIASFKAEEIDMDIKEALNGDDYYDDWEDRKAALADWRKRKLSSMPKAARLVGKEIPEGLWDKKYRERFDFRVRINYADKQCITDMMTMRFLNGEAETLVSEAMRENPFKKRARIKEVNFNWSYGRTIKETKIILDPDEVMEAYNLIYEGEPKDRSCELRIDVNEENNFNRVFLQAVGTEYLKEVELLRADIKIYPVLERNRFKFDVFKDEYEEGIFPPIRKDGKKE